MWRFSSETKLKIDMEKIYTKHTKDCTLVKAQPQTVAFLLNYSKSLKITEVNGLKFESNLN
jgi:hypothetical protein